MRGRFFWILAPLALFACREEATPAPPIEPPATPDMPEEPDAEPRGARSVAEETDTFLFEYTYPQEPGEIPALAAWLDERLEAERNTLANEADRARRAARDDGFPFNKYSSQTSWEVVADLPDYLSLSANLSTYTGGAHPNYGFDAMVWDKQSETAMEPIAFFVSAQALDEVLNEDLCTALNAERARRRGMPVDVDASDSFSACIKADETNLLLGSRSGKKFDRVGVQIAPYLAGPYAEGSYEFTFDVTSEMLEAVKPEYQGAFAARN